MTRISEATTEPTWLKWAWFHFQLCADEYPSLDAALAAQYQADESFVCIEGPDGSMVSQETIDEYDQARRAREDAADAARPKPVAIVEVRAPGAARAADWAWWDSCLTVEDAERLADVARQRFGPDRVKIRRIPRTYS